MASQAERELRDAVVSRLRVLLPEARIIHELKVADGKNRADLAAVTPDKIVLVELKSRRDKLDRLQGQMREFYRHSHCAIAAIDEKHLERKLHDKSRWGPGGVWVSPSNRLNRVQVASKYIWSYPPLPIHDIMRAPTDDWELPPFREMPDAYALLNLLWAAEQKEVMQALTIPAKGARNRDGQNERIRLYASGKQITEQVCAQLRQRPFAEADPPM